METTKRTEITEDLAVVTFEEPGIVGWGVEYKGTLKVRGAMDIALVESMNADPRAMAATEAAKVAGMIRFDMTR